LGFDWKDVSYTPKAIFTEYPVGRAIDVNNGLVDTFKAGISASSKLKKVRFTLPSSANYVYQKLLGSSSKLKSYLAGKRKEAICYNKNFLTLSNFKFGRMGNVLIELKNSIFIAEMTNQTFIIPDWMLLEFLTPFDLTDLKKYFCVISLSEYRERSYDAYIETMFTNDIYLALDVWTNK